jgi:hypothetical protein
MTQEKRFGLSTAQKSDMWRRWKAEQSLHEIGRAFGSRSRHCYAIMWSRGSASPLRGLKKGMRDYHPAWRIRSKMSLL